MLITIFIVAFLLGMVFGAIKVDNRMKQGTVKVNSTFAEFCRKHPTYR